MLDLYLVYQFLRRLAKPFDEWEAYDLGIIDKNGNVLKSRRKLKTKREKDAFGAYDVMILNLKKLIAKAPGGDRRLASYAAALYLLREWKYFTPDSMLNETVTDTEIQQSVAAIGSLAGYIQEDTSIIPGEGKQVKRKVEDLDSFFEEVFGEEAPTNSAGSGAIAGIGVGPDGEPGLTMAARIKYIAKNKRKKKKSEVSEGYKKKKDHFVYQRNVDKTKEVVHRGTEQSSKDWIETNSKFYSHKGKHFDIYKGTYPNVKPSDKLDYEYTHKE